MKRLLGLSLLGLLACGGPDEDDGSGVAATTCPGVSADVAPGDPPSYLSTPVSVSAAPLIGASDGRERVIVRFRPGARSAQSERGVGKVHARWHSLRAYATRVTPAEREALERDPSVEKIEPDKQVHALGWPAFTATSRAFLSAAPNTSGSTGEYTPGLKLVQAHSVWDANDDGSLDPGAATGAGVKICVIDSGLDPRHPELELPVVGGKSFVDGDDGYADKTGEAYGSGHGTHVAGTIAAQLSAPGRVSSSMDARGMVGVAPGASLLIARVLDIEGRGNVSAVVSAVQWCVANGARILSLSLGSEEPHETERTAFTSLPPGVVAIAATGNSGSDNEMGYPAGYPGVVGVGAVDGGRALAGFSQTGFAPATFVEPITPAKEGLVAPGVDVLSTLILGSSAETSAVVDGAPAQASAVEFALTRNYEGPLVDCGRGESKTSCRERTCRGFVAYVERGESASGAELTFAQKVSNVIAQGAGAVIIGNNLPDDGMGHFTIGVEASRWLVKVPVVSVDYTSGQRYRTQAGASARLVFVSYDYGSLSGTSMATPHVSGAAALVLSERPELTACQLRKVLFQSAQDLGAAGFDSQYGWGLVQAKAALAHPTPAACTD